ncbi:hypothetical protein IT396_03255 [Candidatus Nomurabacteria bacterium]|nr:hypothetical protein [Candidatus Nomurabacteria bacterium]
MNLFIVKKVWGYVRWPLTIFIIVFIVFIAWRVQVLNDREATAEAVAAIRANKLTWADINGDLPAEPDVATNNSTLVGVDSNQNGIRDDVERAIYNKYKSTPKVAIAMLQYAKALQMEFTHVMNSETFVAVIQQEGRGYGCADNHQEETENLVFNTSERKEYGEEVRRKYMTSYALLNTKDCDILL